MHGHGGPIFRGAISGSMFNIVADTDNVKMRQKCAKLCVMRLKKGELLGEDS